MNERGFALISLMIVIAASGAVFLVALQQIQMPVPSSAARVDQSFATIRAAATHAYALNGTLPTSLGSLESVAELPTDGHWRIDPYGAATELDYRVTAGAPTTLTVRSTGRDGILSNSDDLIMTVSSQTSGRIHTRDRLRMIRAAFARSAYMRSGAMSAADLAVMRASARGWAIAQRRLFHATNQVERDALVAQRDAARTTIVGLRTAHGLAAPPTAVTGPSGLLSNLGLSDALAVDGFGHALVANDAVGCTSIGGDAIGGTHDDM